MSVKLVTAAVVSGVLGLSGLTGAGGDVSGAVWRYAQDPGYLAGSRWMPRAVASVDADVSPARVTSWAVWLAEPVGSAPEERRWELVAAACELADHRAAGEPPTEALEWVEQKFPGIRDDPVTVRALLTRITSPGLDGDPARALGRAALCRTADALTANYT